MTTSDVERELTAALHRQAEDAMSSTDTREQLERLEARLEPAGTASGVRRVLMIGAATAAAAAVAAAVLVVAVKEDADPGPVDDSSVGQNPDEQVADEFVQVITAHEPAKVRLLLADDAIMPSDWRARMRREDAWSMRYVVDNCTEIGGSDYGTNVVCPFAYYALGSDELGMAPFGNNNFSLVVRDGEVRSFQPSYNGQGNGDAEHYTAFAEWDQANHPGEWSFLGDDTPTRMSHWVRLWQRRTAEFVAAQLE